MVISVDLKGNVLAAAELEVGGFVDHDKGEYLAGAEKYGQSYATVDPYRKHPVGIERCLKAGSHKMGLLEAYDRIVDSHHRGSFTDPSIRKTANFGQMLEHGINESRELDVPAEYGEYTAHWYIEHAEWVRSLTGNGYVPIDGYPFLATLKLARAAFDEGITGDSDFRVSAPFETSWQLYLRCVLLHDHRRLFGFSEHSPEQLTRMRENYQAYLMNLFEHVSK